MKPEIIYKTLLHRKEGWKDGRKEGKKGEKVKIISLEKINDFCVFWFWFTYYGFSCFEGTQNLFPCKIVFKRNK